MRPAECYQFDGYRDLHVPSGSMRFLLSPDAYPKMNIYAMLGRLVRVELNLTCSSDQLLMSGQHGED